MSRARVGGTPREVHNIIYRQEIKVSRRRKGGIKRGESNLAINRIPKCFPLSGTPRKIHRTI